MDELHNLIIQHEGIRLKPYRDTIGKLTIGVGRNLDDCGISQDEAMMLLDHDVEHCEFMLGRYDWYTVLDDVRKGALIELVFNVGLVKTLEFKNMILALTISDYEKAGKELLDSKWASQVGPNRANNMAFRLSKGDYPKS